MRNDFYKISREDLGKDAKIPIIKKDRSIDAFHAFAMEMFETIQKNNAAGQKTVFICPVGPVGHYPKFVELVNEHKLSLHNVWFFNMDEYLDEHMEWIEESSPLSFRGFMNREVYGKIEASLLMPKEQRVFPNPKNPKEMDDLLEYLGGADTCFGGIGINGHIAFNEADASLSKEEFSNLCTRVLEISKETLVTNAIGDLGGAIDAMPRYCVTIGMKQILASKKIRLAVFRDWHRAVCRRTAYGDVTSAFPATLLQEHKDVTLLVNDVASEQAIF